METLLNGPAQLCEFAKHTGVACDQIVFQLNVWNLVVGVLLIFVVAMLARFIMRYRELDTQCSAMNISAPYSAIAKRRMMHMHPHTLARLMKEKGYEQLNYRDACRKLNEKYRDRYFVVQFQEGGREILRTELQLQVPWKGFEANCIRLDAETLSRLKAGTESKVDDGTGDSVGADGMFDLFVREVRWWDLRHWLFHPSREIRLAIYVALFAAALEYSSTIFAIVGVILKAPGS
ncbi:hypothetical protein [Hyphomonas chukchiensis]|uniref:hypothetical protein n=1 Tax=Hyphomonas chukchiensis TaxID=1280947 RepID=UPI0030F6C41E